MMKTFVLLVLSLGLCDFAFGNHLRIFRNYDKRLNWSDALDTCNMNNESLVTAYDAEDLTFASRFTSDSCWLGLHKRHGYVTTWSNGDSLTFNHSQVNITDDNQTCEAMGNRTWKGFNCSDRKPFMCYKDNNYTLIEKEKDWCQALHFCRRHYTDLVTISNDTQNEEVFKKGKNNIFWIGLQHDQWTWTDKSCSTYREFYKSTEGGNCAKITFSSPYLMYKQGCEQESKTLCAKGNARIKVVQQSLTWEQALDYCQANHTGLLWIEDDKDQKAVDQWLNQTGVTGPLWIGLKQSTIFGFWIWSDRTVDYSNWKDNKIPAMPKSNHCGVITQINGTWKWSDENCKNELYFVCEEEIVFM